MSYEAFHDSSSPFHYSIPPFHSTKCRHPANVEQLGILPKNGAHGNIVKSYLELNFIRENTYKKAAVNVSETI